MRMWAEFVYGTYHSVVAYDSERYTYYLECGLVEKFNSPTYPRCHNGIPGLSEESLDMYCTGCMVDIRTWSDWNGKEDVLSDLGA